MLKAWENVSIGQGDIFSYNINAARLMEERYCAAYTFFLAFSHRPMHGRQSKSDSAFIPLDLILGENDTANKLKAPKRLKGLVEECFWLSCRFARRK